MKIEDVVGLLETGGKEHPGMMVSLRLAFPSRESPCGSNCRWQKILLRGVGGSKKLSALRKCRFAASLRNGKRGNCHRHQGGSLF